MSGCNLFTQRVFEHPPKCCANYSGIWLLRGSLVPHQTAVVSAYVLCTPCSHAPVKCHSNPLYALGGGVRAEWGVGGACLFRCDLSVTCTLGTVTCIFSVQLLYLNEQ